MKLIISLSSILLVTFVGLTSAQEDPSTSLNGNKVYEGPITARPGLPTPPTNSPSYDGPSTDKPEIPLYTGPATEPNSKVPSSTTYDGPPTQNPEFSTEQTRTTLIAGPPTLSTSGNSKYPTTGTTSSTTLPPQPTTPKGKPCGSNNLGDYKGGCDESVPVIVLPKGRPVMERVLDWFKCGTKSCLKR